ncbi:rRNA pseudouridine synthase [Candidatus Aminicenantes bacterium AC-335-B20]|jgi:pseudouridine synthase|nr:rRNA pseudouridine synthase [SCandidatus Aminicenantes bacterium Aminicenantia_JdfR_composite]MCP2596956.1 rRNA pseudouridine synthase [Candidatus Aminicenantes bacterium AC-335-G13]MCP2599097.1 rRNA pseudouridine synthase [Candidatus Aminicenantes bacterium AC-335-B20]MCP2605952.1 rRNA pseudouridine synthase [Candidatus Aminicenantes bacterium AC-708-I09]MCP2618291.1 rRNA pseudouridine synthase [Candidatus Aminicenantes bacterium AC-335-A11]MCP2619608.1 rRNA pseudouridine synthase [Candida
MKIRLNKFIAICGIVSRRKADELIKQGRVTVNGEIVEKLGIKVDPEKDIVEVDGKKISYKENLIYLVLYKPKGYIVSLRDPFNRPKVMDLLPDFKERIFPVGRLDYDSEGILLLTNDGELAYRLTHPRYKVERVYRVEVKGIPSPEKLEKLEKGIPLYGKRTAPSKVKLIAKKGKKALLEIKLYEGRKRQVKLMFLAIGHPVLSLKRISFGGITIKGLKPGEWRHLNKKEIKVLKKNVSLLD